MHFKVRYDEEDNMNELTKLKQEILFEVKNDFTKTKPRKYNALNMSIAKATALPQS